MSKYIKLEDAIYGDCILIDEIKCEDCPFYNEERFSCRMVEWLADLPTIEVSEDCISREWLKGRIEKVSYENEWHMTETDDFVSWENIESAPSVTTKAACGATIFVSTEPIVRCKDCKHWNDFYSKCTKWTVDTYEQAQTNAEDFCSYGERTD